MPDPLSPGNDFLQQATEVIEENMPDEGFGVTELAREMGMSRSSLLRKVKKAAGLSVSQLIRQVRLERGMELLKQDGLTVSEIAYRVGFGSTSYFIKCFREHYGYPPGEAEHRDFDETEAPPPARPHRLAAIMFTDIQGYTALMQQDEEQALQLRNRHREVFNAVTRKYNGKILQYYGDGTLSIFQSAIDAVKCGIELQRGFRAAPGIPVRIGIHSGDIIINEEDIIGDGVNVASRIESLAAAGSVFISEKVYDEVKNQPDIQTTTMGAFEFKNVSKPLEVFAVTNPGLAVPEAGQLTGKLRSGQETGKEAYGSKRRKNAFIWALAAIATVIGGYFIVRTGFSGASSPAPVAGGRALPEKSIAVLPFINDSNDSTNVYIINGLMESILNNLQKIEDLRVISRTSVEKYRYTQKIIPEIAQELGVKYFVEGSGQKDGDQILLSIQLIEAPTDRHLWSEQYNRQVTDIFSLQAEVAKKIADEIQAVITPEEEQRIGAVLTENMEAYAAFLQGLDFSVQRTLEGLKRSIPFYEKAIVLDPEFASAYAALAISYYFLDAAQAEKQYTEQINNYADKALLYGAQLPESRLAKGLYYLHRGDYESALPHLEKALEYNPNYALAINMLSDYYTSYVPNTERYLEYALKGIRLDPASNDSVTASFTYLHISNAFIQSGFVEEAEKYINKSLAYYPDNLYSQYVKAYILYARGQGLAQTKAMLLETLARDPTRLDVMQEVAKICYFMRDYQEAYRYYKKFADTREAYNLNIYPAENAKIAMTMRKVGKEAEAEKYMQLFRDYTAADQSIYQEMNAALISAFDGNTTQALEQLKAFSKEENYHYWILLFTEMDPLMDEIKTHPAFRKIIRGLERKFRERQERIRRKLEEEGLM